ncbi:hypothetical protein [Eubacterium maltosivorans]|uniref:hypothetical protein n=1 Tax=Eubacterium maltosivorans TaxID=2041044 RepID=UPI003A9152EF
MSVQIDMEMPMNCRECRFCSYEVYGGIFCNAHGDYGREISPYTNLQLSSDRRSWCPLVEVEA